MPRLNKIMHALMYTASAGCLAGMILSSRHVALIARHTGWRVIICSLLLAVVAFTMNFFIPLHTQNPPIKLASYRNSVILKNIATLFVIVCVLCLVFKIAHLAR